MIDTSGKASQARSGMARASEPGDQRSGEANADGHMQSLRAARLKQRMARAIEAWEDEGGAVPDSLEPVSTATLTGTEAQVEWAMRIRRNVRAEFDRVAASFRSIAAKQSGDKREETEAIIAIVERMREEVMAREQAGYFIHDWQDISDQVRQMIFHDARYVVIKSRRSARHRQQ